MQKQLNDILINVKTKKTVGSTEKNISSIVLDSRHAQANSLFVAIKGTQTDGHQFINNAIANGASVILCEDLPQNMHNDITYITVSDCNQMLGFIASDFYDQPSTKLQLIGITGTNGKTTIATLLYRLFSQLGNKAGLISTINNFINNDKFSTTHTTPNAIEINKLLNEMVANQCKYCFMEVSSHAVIQKRIAGLHFTGGVFTNITHDHLDYHKTFDAYINAKKTFFDTLSDEAFALINSDDRNANIMVQNTKAQIHTFAIKSFAQYRCQILESDFNGMKLMVDGNEMWTKLIGDFNASNLTAVYATAMLLGEERNQTLTLLSGMKPVDGRFETIHSLNGITAIVDYAHTPDALKNVLQTLNEIKIKNQKIITIVGAGGNRDKIKRPIMAKTALEYSDKAIFTSDNPRNENPGQIINDMLKGVDKANEIKILTIENRREAIKTACQIAQQGDIILVAGKGHETYQEINDIKYDFDDKKTVQYFFDLLEAHYSTN